MLTRIPPPVPRLERSPRDGPEGGWPHFLSRVVGERRKRAQSCGPTEVSAEALTASRRLRDAVVWVPPATDGTPAFPWPQPSRHPGVAGLGLRAPGSGPGCAGSAPPPRLRLPAARSCFPGPGPRAWGGGGAQGSSGVCPSCLGFRPPPSLRLFSAPLKAAFQDLPTPGPVRPTACP